MLILLRHGQSTANADLQFTGWLDVQLTRHGRHEARRAGQLLRSAGLEPTEVHTSLLRRAIASANLALEEMDRTWLPVYRSWRLNERHYGALTGLSKREVSAHTCPELFHRWRRSWADAPPCADDRAIAALRADRRYASLPIEAIPATESLEAVAARLQPYLVETLLPAVAAGGVPLVVSHGNTLRAMIALLDNLTPQEVEGVDLATGAPHVYRFDGDLSVRTRGGESLDPVAHEHVKMLVAEEGSRQPRGG